MATKLEWGGGFGKAGPRKKELYFFAASLGHTENIGKIVSFKIHNTIEFLSHSLPISHSLTHTHTCSPFRLVERLTGRKLGELGEPEDIAEAALFLASDQ